MEGLEDAGFDFIAANGLVVVAAALITRTEAAETVFARHDEPGATHTALRQTREQVLRTPRADGISCRPDGLAAVLLAMLRNLPQLVGYDAQLRDFLPHPLGHRVHTRHALSGVGILHVPKAIPHQAADVELVVEDSRSARGVAVDRAWTPGAAEWTGHAFAIQILGDLLRRHARNEFAEDPLDEGGLRWFDFPFPRRYASAADCLDHPIAVAEAAGRLSVFDPAAQSAVSLLREILQEQCVHRALEPDVQVRDVTLGERDDVHAGEGEALEETGRVFLVAAEAIQRFGENNIEPPVQRIAHEGLETGAQQRGAGDCVIGELLDDRPALASSELAADSELVRD